MPSARTEGGHDAIHKELGTFADFERLIKAAKAQGLEIALDFAIQCSPDHPWIKQHPAWFDWRPDGSIKFAENPPKKYEDIVNVHFYGDAFPSIWLALRDIVLFWAEKGVRIFRVDNPHTKPFPFWEWMIREVQDRYPDVIFLAEAFTRPAPMKRLAKLGFTQSYTYFTWRNTKQELTEYATELTESDMREYFRPNFFVNTPDINPPYLQTSGRAGFQARLVLAATLAGNYGIYNGVEICEARAIPGKEEYLDSEKYEIARLGLGPRGQYPSRRHAHQPAAQRHIRRCSSRQSQLLQFLERPDSLLRQGQRGSVEFPAVRGQSRSAQRTRRPFRSAAVGVWPAGQRRYRRRGSRDGQALHLVGQGAAFAARSDRPALRDLAPIAEGEGGHEFDGNIPSVD